MEAKAQSHKRHHPSDHWKVWPCSCGTCTTRIHLHFEWVRFLISTL